jgi:hypothetical protein
MGADYSADEIEFMMAMERFKRTHHRPYPDCGDVIEVIRNLGYRKQVDDQAPGNAKSPGA